jgi:energy-coupling factor transporter ATP-binding protein EcfA2
MPVPNLADLDLRLKCPFTLLVAGPSGCGKTSFIHRLLAQNDQLYNKPPGKVYWFYRVYQKVFDTMKYFGVVDEFIQGMVTMEWIKENVTEPNSTIVIDDLAGEISVDTATIFTVGSHHYNVNVILVCQNLFTKNPSFRDISINTQGTVMFKFPRDSSSIVNLAKQVAPGRSKDVLQIYREATKKPFSYVYFDYHQATPDDIRFRSNILWEGGLPIRLYRMN